MKQLTKDEENIMQILWKLKKANVKTIIEEFPEPKPADKTVSTIVRILENKGFVDYEKEGKGHVYFPLVIKQDYSNQSIDRLVDNYFKGLLKAWFLFL